MLSSLDPPPRSWLFVPGLAAVELLPKAIRSGADAVVLDLEDAVPEERKAEAVECVGTALQRHRAHTTIFVRVNRATHGRARQELALVTEHRLAGVLVPKVSGPRELEPFLDALPAANPDGGSSEAVVLPMIESAAGVLNAAEIASCDPRVAGLALGAEDLGADLGGRAPTAVRYASAQLVLAARAVGRWTIDSPCMEVHRPALWRRESRIAVALGFVGKLAIHPAQVPAINVAFAPSAAERDAAERILEAWSERAIDREAVIVVDGSVVDEPVVAAARRLLSLRSHTDLDDRDTLGRRPSKG